MKKLINTQLLFFLFISFTALAQEFHDLNGIETKSGRTYLLYRIEGPSAYSSVFKLDLDTQQEERIMFGFYFNSPLGLLAKAINDYEFFPEDSINFINVGNEINTELWGTIYRNDSLIFSIPFEMIKVDISKQNSQKVFVGADYNYLFRSFDGGYTFLMDSAIQFTMLSLSPFNDNIIFGLDGFNRLIKSFDGGSSSVLVDTSKIDDVFNTKFLYDSDQQHIYRVNRNYNEYIFSVSDNSGNQFSWTKTFESNLPIYISIDNSLSGVIFLSTGRYIYKSNNYGLTFQLYKTFEKKVTGIYKKPNSDILFASTKYKIYKITPDTLTVIKSFPVPTALFDYYPLKVGNKWIYDQTTFVDDFPPQVYFITIVKEVISDSVAPNNKKYFVIKEGLNDYSLERIDSTTGKVYRYIFGSGFPDDELLIDDLTLEVGDTVNSFRMGYYSADGFTTLREITNFTRWGSGNKRKIFETYTLGMPVYSLTDGYGLDSSYYEFDFGHTINLLRGCVINGVAFGDTVLSIENNENVPMNFVLYQNYPNPFNPGTTIKWSMPRGERVTIKLFDILGREIETIVDGYYEAGNHSTLYIANSELSSGVYFYQLRVENPSTGSGQVYVETKKMIVLK